MSRTEWTAMGVGVAMVALAAAWPAGFRGIVEIVVLAAAIVFFGCALRPGGRR